MAGRNGEYYGNSEVSENYENKEQKQELPEHFESKYKLKEEAQEYETGDGEYKYETDKQGRIKRCYGKLELHPEQERNNYAQLKAGGEDRRTDEITGKDEGGHLIGRRFGGSPEIDNIIAQDSKLNRGDYKKMEDNWESYLKEKDENGEPKYHVYADIRCKYNEVKEDTGKKDSERPSDIFVYSKVTDNQDNVVEKKVYRFKNESDPETKVHNMTKAEDERSWHS